MLGEEDIINMRYYSSTVKCTSSTGSLYVIKREDFLGKLSQNEQIWEKVRADARLKD